MPPQRTAPAAPQRPQLRPDEMRTFIKRLRQRSDDLRKLKPDLPKDEWDTQRDIIVGNINSLIVRAFGERTRESGTFSVDPRLTTDDVWVAFNTDSGRGREPDPVPGRKGGIAQAQKKVDAAINQLSEDLEDAGEPGKVLIATSGAAVLASDAPDRVVRLQHDDPILKNIRDTLAELKTGMDKMASNAEAEEHGRLQAEMMASIQVMRAEEVRVGVVEELIVRVLKWIAEKFASEAVGMIAKGLMAIVCAYFSIPIP